MTIFLRHWSLFTEINIFPDKVFTGNLFPWYQSLVFFFNMMNCVGYKNIDITLNRKMIFDHLYNMSHLKHS